MCEPEAGVALTPEGEFVCRIAQTDGDLRNGSAITWEEPYEEREPVSPRRLDDDIQQWLGRVYELCGASEIDPALDLVLDEVDDLLYPGGDVARCDRILAAADVDRMAVEVMLAFLMETARAKAALPARAGLFQRIEAKLLVVEPRRAHALLANLQ